MRTIIAGSRSITDYNLVVEVIKHCPWTITEVICGEARGVDTLGKRWAEENNIPVTSFPADWKKWGKRSGPIRNRQMSSYARESRPGGLILVWDGQSRGSASMLEIACADELRIWTLKAYQQMEELI